MLSDHQLAEVIGITLSEFAGLPLWVQVFCRELASAAGAVAR